MRQINEDPEIDDEGKAAAIAIVNELGKEGAAASAECTDREFEKEREAKKQAA